MAWHLTTTYDYISLCPFPSFMHLEQSKVSLGRHMSVSLMRELCNLSEVHVKKQERKSSRMVGRKTGPGGSARIQGPEVQLVNTITVN
jgi:hypothetical protein